MHHLLLAGLTALAPISAADSPGADDIVTTAVKAGSFSTLAAALEAAGLVDPLRGEGPFTVFAPSDEAFAKLGSHAIADLLEPENRERLTAILTYHVVPGRLAAADVLAQASVTTLQGQRAPIRADDDGAFIASARITATDIACSNGIIHVIDSVLLPAQDDIVATAAKAGSFTTLLAAAKAAGLAGTLSDGGPFTVFAPTDAAFAALPAGTVESLLRPENKSRLATILKFHVVPGRIYSDAAAAARSAATLAGAPVAIAIDEGRLRIGGASVVANDIDASNGVIHVIDTVLLPPAPPQPQGRLVLGVHYERPGAALATQLGIERKSSLLITRVVKGSEAERAGLTRYDVVTSVGGKAATDKNVDQAKKDAGFGGTVHLELLRAAKPITIDCKVGIERH